MNILITILARAGSKGCPCKHTRLCAGKKLFKWTIDLAVRWKRLPHLNDVTVVVSSDSSAVLGIASGELGPADRIIRPPELATDSAAKVPAIRHALVTREACVKIIGTYPDQFDVIIDLDATAPIRTTDDIDGALALFQLKKPDCVMSCTVGVGRNPYFNLLEIVEPEVYFGDTKPQLQRCKPMDIHVADPIIHNRQEAPDVYEANSSIYVYSREFLLREDVQSPLDGVCIPYVMPDESYFHVDSMLDFNIVEFLLKRREGHGAI